MNISYYRKSKDNFDNTLENIKNFINDLELTIDEIIKVKEDKVVFKLVYNNLYEEVVKEDKNIVGLINPSIVVIKEEGEVLVGYTKPTVVSQLTKDHDLQHKLKYLEDDMEKLVNEVTGTGDAIPSKIILYSTKSCPYCKMEKSWLDDNNIEHEVVYVDENPEKGRELVEKTGQRGVPITEMEYEDMDTEYIIGFNKPELSKMLKIDG